MLYKYGLYLPSGIGNSYKEINYVIKTIKHILKVNILKYLNLK